MLPERDADPGGEKQVSFQDLLDERDAAREAHEGYCAAVNEEGEWGIVTDAAARRLHLAYLALQERVDSELEAERAEGL